MEFLNRAFTEGQLYYFARNDACGLVFNTLLNGVGQR